VEGEYMKSCPTCNRTFEDSLTFCLVDGAILSAPYDAQATQRLPETGTTNPPPTEFLASPIPLGNAMPPTMLYPQPSKYKTQIEDIPKALSSKQKSSKRVGFTKMAVRGAIIGAGAGAFIGLILEGTGYHTGWRMWDFEVGVVTFVYTSLWRINWIGPCYHEITG
jgi:hypothetical protein